MSTPKSKSKPSTTKAAPKSSKRAIPPVVAPVPASPAHVTTLKEERILSDLASMAADDFVRILALHFARKAVAGIPVFARPTEYEHALPSGGTITMARIAGGTFARGGDKYDDEKNGGTITVSAYSLAKYPTTVGQFRAFVAATKHVTDAEKAKDTRTWRSPGFAQDDTHPVVCVTRERDIPAFCEWAGLSLPTEAQWEYAARGTDGRVFPWGDDAPDDTRLWWSGTTRRIGTCPVGTHPAGASPFGIHDMAGNVWEWVADWFANYDPSVTTDPTGPATGTSRVLRGGCWGINDSDYVRAALRNGNSPSSRWGSDGFRCARGA